MEVERLANVLGASPGRCPPRCAARTPSSARESTRRRRAEAQPAATRAKPRLNGGQRHCSVAAVRAKSTRPVARDAASDGHWRALAGSARLHGRLRAPQTGIVKASRSTGLESALRSRERPEQAWRYGAVLTGPPPDLRGTTGARQTQNPLRRKGFSDTAGQRILRPGTPRECMSSLN